MTRPSAFAYGLLISLTVLVVFFLFNTTTLFENNADQPMSEKPSEYWWKMQLQDPSTKKIPLGVRKHDLDFISNNFPTGLRSNNELAWKNIGPYNIGGRTRTVVLDWTNTQRIIAGSASGGIFKSVNEGKTWKKVTSNEHNVSISWIHQDTRLGKENMFYASTGEARGASQGAPNFSAHFGGDGVLVSKDFGDTWYRLGSFINDSPQRLDSLDLTWKILVDNQSSKTVLMLVASTGIYRSEDEGVNWLNVMGNKQANQEIDLVQTSEGIWYAVINNGIGSSSGLFRSVDGINFEKIKTLAASIGRGAIGINSQNENAMFIVCESPNTGQKSDFLGRNGYHSLYKYIYKSGNGSGAGGILQNLSANLPKGGWPFDDFHSQSGYCIDIKVSPFDSNLVAIAGVNLNISHNGFSTPNEAKHAGGYYHKIDTPFYRIYPNHHPDVHTIVFHPTDPKIIITGSDGGIHLSRDVYAKHVEWESLNNGYVTTQFYTLALDKKDGSNKIIGGLQDNGTLYYLADSLKNWTMPVDYDGAYCFFVDYAPYFLAAKQQAGLFKVSVNTSGQRLDFARIDPAAPSNYLFINPYTIDPNNNKILYLPNGNQLWRCKDISQFPLNNHFEKQTTGWDILNIAGLSGLISAVEVSKEPANTLYVGTSGGGIFKIDSANGNYIGTNISISGQNGFVSSIAINPKNSNNVVVVFSNYNVYSVFMTENGGNSWQNISGNIEGKIQPGVPSNLTQINDGPSCRIADFIELEDANWLLLGTSVGLFGTLNPDSMDTQWDRVGETTIGTNVVTAIDYRKSDGYLGIATHGSGVFTSFVTSSKNIIGNEEIKKEEKLIVYPNPCKDYLNITTKTEQVINEISIVNLSGQAISCNTTKKGEIIRVNTDKLQQGTYFVYARVNRKVIITPFIKF